MRSGTRPAGSPPAATKSSSRSPSRRCASRPAAAAQTWGIGFARVRPRRDRLELASEPVERNRNCSVCQLSTIAGFAGISPGRHLELDPTLTVQQVARREDVPDGRLETEEIDVEPGLTVTWGVTPDIILSGTANPDFSQVEADALELDVNQQFAIFYPERRPFFLEGADIFTTPFQVVFTRNVADPDWGAKVTGKRGASAFGSFSRRTRAPRSSFPGSERSELAELPGGSTDAVVRYRRDLGSRTPRSASSRRRGRGERKWGERDGSNQVAGRRRPLPARRGRLAPLPGARLAHRVPGGDRRGLRPARGRALGPRALFLLQPRLARLAALRRLRGRRPRLPRRPGLPAPGRPALRQGPGRAHLVGRSGRALDPLQPGRRQRAHGRSGRRSARAPERALVHLPRPARVDLLHPGRRPRADHRRDRLRRALRRRPGEHPAQRLARAPSRLERRRRRRPRGAAAGRADHALARPHLGTRAPPARRARASLPASFDRRGLALHRPADGAAPGLAVQPAELRPRHPPAPRSRARHRPVFRRRSTP